MNDEGDPGIEGTNRRSYTGSRSNSIIYNRLIPTKTRVDSKLKARQAFNKVTLPVMQVIHINPSTIRATT